MLGVALLGLVLEPLLAAETLLVTGLLLVGAVAVELAPLRAELAELALATEEAELLAGERAVVAPLDADEETGVAVHQSMRARIQDFRGKTYCQRVEHQSRCCSRRLAMC